MSDKIHFPESGIEAAFKEGETLLDTIRGTGLPIEAVCSGRGLCGKCRVTADGEERLACQTPAACGMRVKILSSAEDHVILTDSGAGQSGSMASPGTSSGKSALAIDVGTTTIVIKAVDTGSGEELAVRAFTNPQRIYGADVLSRINESMDDAGMLSKTVREALDAAIRDITGEGRKLSPEKIVVAGNTTMMYLLLGLRTRSLGLAPFEPEFQLEPVYSYKEVFGSDALPCEVHIYPFISSFIGGDIMSGLVNIGLHLETGPSPSYILVDMGTNGEIAYRNGERLLATSTAAGPALEGGNIVCGMGGLPGAIYEVVYKENGKFTYRTIADKPALGICGSGVISLMGELLRAGLVTETGAFSEEADRLAQNKNNDAKQKQLVIAEANDDGTMPVGFTQKDVREFQLAKGAIRAGIDILIEEMGEAPERIYLAGGFGQNIDLESALKVGLIPRDMKAKVRFAGNTALGGCVDACIDPGEDASSRTDSRIASLLAMAEEINLGSHMKFNEKFMETMMFEEAK